MADFIRRSLRIHELQTLSVKFAGVSLQSNRLNLLAHPKKANPWESEKAYETQKKERLF